MLHFNDFVAGRKRFYNLSRGLCISAAKHCRKMTHSSDTSKENLLSLFNIVTLGRFCDL